MGGEIAWMDEQGGKKDGKRRSVTISESEGSLMRVQHWGQ